MADLTPPAAPVASETLTRRRLLTTAALSVGAGLGATSLLSGCNAASPSAGPGSASSGSGGGGAKTKLTVMYASTELTKAHIAEFEKLNPDITVEFIENDGTRFNAMLAAGTPPDFVRGAAVGSANNNARGLAASLDPYLDHSTVLKRDDLLAVNDAWRWDGSVSGKGTYYGLTKDWSQDATLWHNTKLFAAAGLPPLDSQQAVSWDDLLEIARKTTRSSGGKTQQHGLGVEWAWGTSGQIFSMIQQQGGSLYNEGLAQTDFTTPQAQRAFQWYVDYAKAGVGPTSLRPLPDGFDYPTFQNQKMACSQDGYWFGGNFAGGDGAALQNMVRMAPAPTFDRRVSVCFAGIGAWIPAKAKNKDAAWRMMEYFMAGPPAVERAKSGWGLPALQSLWTNLPQKLPYQQEAFKTAQNELKFIGLLPDSPYINIGNWITELDKQLQAAITGKASVQDACSKVTENINKLLARGKDQIG